MNMVDIVKAKGPKRNNAVGKKGRSGRKSKAEEVKMALEYCAKKVTDDALVKLSQSRLYDQLSKDSGFLETARITKELALPIYLKNKADKVIFSEKSYDNDQRARLAERINARRNRNSGGK